MDSYTEKLYQLLPALYRDRDAEEGHGLRALLELIGEQADLLDKDIQQLYEDFFIETCRPWVIPYIGELVSNNLLYDSSRLTGAYLANELFDDLLGVPRLQPPVAARVRADVAKTIYYRRRKGTLPMLEELARDVTGWPAHAVEFFELLGWTQHLEHLRSQSQWTDVRSVERMDLVDGPFDRTSHSVDVRQINQFDGWHDIEKIGFFLWRLGGFPLANVPARFLPEVGSPSWRFHFSPLGNPAPLFSQWRREGDEAGLATELHVPAPIRRAFFFEDLREYQAAGSAEPFTKLYGLFEAVDGIALDARPEAGFFVIIDNTPVHPQDLVCRRLDSWPSAQPSGDLVGVDVATGRLILGDNWTAAGATPSVDVLFHYGFPANLGGGPYERQSWLVRPELAEVHYRVKEDGVVPPGAPPATHTSVTAALADWASPGDGNRRNTIIQILDSRTYSLPAFIELSNENFLGLEAADGERPVLQSETAGLEIRVAPPAQPADPDRGAEFTLSGVVLEGSLDITGDLGRLRILHSTLVPGRRLTEEGLPATSENSIEVAADAPDNGDTVDINTQLRVEMAFSISGPIEIPDHADGIWVLDSILDGLQPGGAGVALTGPAARTAPAATLERSTVLGEMEIRSLEASESILVGVTQATRTQEGCVRFSWVRPGSITPRRYRCQPDLAVEIAIKKALDANPALTQAEKDQIRQDIESYLLPSFTSIAYGQPAYAQLRLNAPLEIRTGAEDGSEMGVFSHVKQMQRESNLRIRLEEYLPFGLEPGIIYVT